MIGITLLAGLAVPLCSGAAVAAPNDPTSPSRNYLMGLTAEDSLASPFSFQNAFSSRTIQTPLSVSTSTGKTTEKIQSSPAVVVASDAVWEVETTQITVTPAPEPEPEPIPVVVAPEPDPVSAERGTSAPRSAERQARTQEPAPEPVAAPAPAPVVASGGVMDIAASLVGVPYVSGGTTTSGFDCSGYTQFVYAQAGVSLPRTSGAQGASGVAVSKADGQPGDLVAMSGHVGIYAGNGMMYDSPRPGKTIQLRAIWTEDYQLRRVL